MLGGALMVCKTIICNDKDPTSFNNGIRQTLNTKTEIFRSTTMFAFHQLLVA